MVFKTRIHAYERGLWFRHGDFKQLLEPGVYILPGAWFGRDRVEIVDTLKTEFRHRKLDILLEDAALRGSLEVVDLNDEQRAFVWKDGRLGWILGPGRHAFWKEPYRLEIEIYDTSEARLEHPKLDTILSAEDAPMYLMGIDVPAHEKVLVFRDGKLVEVVGPGRHAFWNEGKRVTWKAVDMREQVTDVQGQEIMTRDKVTLRLNLLVAFRIVDPVRAVTTVTELGQALYREAQLALRAAVGTRTLEQLLVEKDAVGTEVRDVVAERATEFGVEVRNVGLRDVILPGDMKTILNQVIEAQKQAEANLIRRREETAAARSQANTARLLADNPVLARMKELEHLQEILRGAKATFVFGAGELTDQVKQLVTRREDDG